MDFYQIKERSTKQGIEVYPDFEVCKSKDLMVRGKSFYAIWNEEIGLWSTDEYDVQRLVDADLRLYTEKRKENADFRIVTKYMSSFSTNSWVNFRKYMSNISDCSKQLDSKLTFSNTQVKKSDFVSKRLPYPLEEGSYEAFDELIGTLYDPEERAKLEWSIGAIVSGDSRNIQKFVVLYGEAGTGKSTILNIIQKLFEGYYTAFEAKALTSSSNAFSTEVFKSNPLVAIQHDGDLSRIEDNSKLNSIVSHEEMTMNEKYKPSYMARANCFLFMGTNRPVKITDAKSGIIRRLIDVRPSGRKLSPSRYNKLMSQVDFELGAIAYHCLQVYKEMGKSYYNGYRPLSMMYETDTFFNFVEDNYFVFKEEDGVSLKSAYEMYKTYCEETGIDTYKLPRHKFRGELQSYFDKFEDRAYVDGKHIRSYFSGFQYEKFGKSKGKEAKEEKKDTLELNCTKSLFDDICASCYAQYATASGTPSKKWDNVKTELKDIDTSKLHYVKLPENHIVIDFDIRGDDGKKSLAKNLEAASKWPKTYMETSKSGNGLHLHYIYDGDTSRLSRIYDEHIEIKVFTGNSSLRRCLTKCNDIPIATINSGLPMKGAKVLNPKTLSNEKALRTLIKRNLAKEIHPGTKPSIDFIKTILDDAYASDMKYDVSDLRPAIQSFAINSTNQSSYCLKMVGQMKFKSEEPSEPVAAKKDELIFFDIEVYPNLFLVVWKTLDGHPVTLINPKPTEIEDLIQFKLVGFNCRRYDNHILYGRLLGYNNEQLYNLSQRIINGERSAMFGEAYNISYTDVYDFSSKKQSLKKFEIELGIHHQEMGLRWDEPVPEELWPKVAEYCVNDVIATEATFKAREADWIGRQILAELSGLSVNDTTNSHTTRIIFGSDKKPSLVYTDLATGEQSGPVPEDAPKDIINSFPGYAYIDGKNIFRGEDVGKGGYVYARPGMYFGNIVTFDVESQHPHSIIAMSCFGKYTKRFEELLHARMYIKHKDFDKARSMLGGALAPYLNDERQAKDLAYALKIAINSVYGLTSASFENPFKDIRNKNNIVALRGALFMMTLRDEIINRGFEVIHIKTDSIKVVNPTKELSDFIFDFAKKYGYNFEIEHVFEKICLVNDAVYIAKLGSNDPDSPGTWTATGAQFAHPYVFKTLFSKEDLEFKDYCETKTVNTALYLDFNETLEDVELLEREMDYRRSVKNSSESSVKKRPRILEPYSELSDDELAEAISKGHDYHFVGKAGSFVPVVSGSGGGLLVREKDGKYFAATGTKGFRWLEAEVVESLNKQKYIDQNYGRNLVDAAVSNISQYGDFEQFISNEPPVELPWC